MRSTCFPVILILSTLALGLPATAASLGERVDLAMRAEIAKQNIVGLAVGVIEGGRITYIKGYGFADREKRVPVTRKTMFRWASISKSLTAVAAMQLWERDQLELDRDVRKYVPEFPDKGVIIKVRQLLCHQAGIVHYTNGPTVVNIRSYDTAHPFENVVFALDSFKASPLVNAPGEKYSYTTHGYILLSAAVERAGKQKFAHQVRDRIVKPLKLTTLQPDYQWVNIPHRAVGYRKRNNAVIVSTDTDVSWKLGGGGFISNIDDLVGFAVGLMNQKLMKPATLKKMWSRQSTTDGLSTAYGLGFSFKLYHDAMLFKWNDGGQGMMILGHSGSQEKTKTYMAIRPSQKMGVAVMTNSEYADPSKLAARLLSVVMPPDSR